MTSKSVLNIQCLIVLDFSSLSKFLLVCLFCLERTVFRNTTLKYMVGTLGHSYMCQKEKSLSVTQDFSLNTFQLQVQPFGVNGNFGAGIFLSLFTLCHFCPLILDKNILGSTQIKITWQNQIVNNVMLRNPRCFEYPHKVTKSFIHLEP